MHSTFGGQQHFHWQGAAGGEHAVAKQKVNADGRIFAH
jgi:hypothetical protein